MNFLAFDPIYLEHQSQDSFSAPPPDALSPATSSGSSSSSNASLFASDLSPQTRILTRDAGYTRGMLSSAQIWGEASESPASEPYPTSSDSSSPHRHTYDGPLAKDSQLHPMTTASRFTAASSTTTTTTATESALASDDMFASASHSLGGGRGAVGQGEAWYDPEGADRYSAAQAFLTAIHPFASASYSAAIPSSSLTSPHTFSNNQTAQMNYPNQPYINATTSYSGLRDPYTPNVNNPQPSAFATSSMSAHHRTSSFGSAAEGSDLGSPPSSLNIYPSTSQQSFYEGQMQNQSGSWMRPGENLGSLQALQDMRLSEASSPFLGQQQIDNRNVYGYPSEAATSTSSLHSQLSQHSGFREPQGAPEGSLEQLIAQQQSAEQQGAGRQPVAPPLPSFAVDDTSMTEGAGNIDKFDPSVNMLTFEQVLEQMRSHNDVQPVNSLLQHPNHSVPNLSSSSPWPPSSSSAASSDSLQQGSASESYLSVDTEVTPSNKQLGDTMSGTAPSRQPHRLPTRDDSFDKLKKYLKLDVNMAYAGPVNDSPTTTITRKRSASDAGPMASAVTAKSYGSAGNGIGFDGYDFTQLGAKLGLEFSGIEAKTPGINFDGSATVMAVQHQGIPARGHGLQQQWMQQRNEAGGAGGDMYSGGGGGGSSSRRGSVSRGENGGVGPMRGPTYASSMATSSTGTPYGSASSRRASIVQQQGVVNGLGGNRSGGTPGWSFPNSGHGDPNVVAVPQDGGTALRRNRSRQRQTQHRIVQSEDLTGAAHARDPSEFLRYITAPDGTLAPPGVAGRGPLGHSPSSQGSTLSFGGQHGSQPLRHAYQTSHDRYGSFGSNEGGSNYNSLAPSMSDLGQRGSMHPPLLPPHPRSGGAAQQIQQGQGLSPSMFQGRASGEEQRPSPGPLPSPGHSPGLSSNGAPNRSPGSGGSPLLYSQTALPTYGSLAPPPRRGRGSNAGGASSDSRSSLNLDLSPSLVNPPVQTVTTSATQAASASRRKNDAHFVCPVPGCGSHFTRQFNLRSHLRSHADERPFQCPDCDKAFARAHDAKRHHETLHLSVKKHICEWCSRQFARLDALHRHLKPESGGCGEKQAEKDSIEGTSIGGGGSGVEARNDRPSTEGTAGETLEGRRDASTPSKFSGHVL